MESDMEKLNKKSLKRVANNEIKRLVETNLRNRRKHIDMQWRERQIKRNNLEMKLSDRDFKQMITKACISSMKYDAMNNNLKRRSIMLDLLRDTTPTRKRRGKLTEVHPWYITSDEPNTEST